MDIALALGGGGIKGVAHLGVIQRLEQAGYQIKAIAGTSAGGLVGSLYASGLPIDSIIGLLGRFGNTRLFNRLSTDGPSLMGLAGFTSILIDSIGDKTFADLKIPFACTAVDIHTGREFFFHEGCLVDAVLATIAVPGVFPSRKIGDATLVDGGILDPVPVALARSLAPDLPVVAVVLTPVPEKWAKLPDIRIPITNPIPLPILETLSRLRLAQAMQIFIQSTDISSRQLAELRLAIDKPDVIIRPEVDQYDFLAQIDPIQSNGLLQAGKSAAEEALPAIHEAASWVNRMKRVLRRKQPAKNPAR